MASVPAESVTIQFVFGNDQFSDTGPVPITEENLQPVIDALIGIGVDAGAVLTILANSMMPEALKHGGKLLGC